MKILKRKTNFIYILVIAIFMAVGTISLPVKSFGFYNKAAMNLSLLSVQQQLDKAKKDGKAVFLVITGTGAIGVENANKTANDAKAKYAKSEVISLNKDESANSELVKKLGIASVPVPFFLVISPKGLAVAGYSVAQGTADLLVKAVPSPKQDEVLIAISEKKPVFIIVSKKGLADKATIVTNCKSASAKTTSKAAVVEIDFNDSKEKAFLTQMGVTSVGDKTRTIVANASGQITDRYEGATEANILVASANRVIKSGGCAPGACGGNKSCGPK